MKVQSRILAVLFILPALLACEPPPGPRVITGLVDATEIDVASKVPGRVKELFVREGDSVKAGQKLVEMESQELQAKVDQVQAAGAAARAKLRLAKAGARDEERRAAEQQLDFAQHQLDLAKKMYERMTNLLAGGAIPQSTFDDVESRYRMAQDQLAMAETRHTLVMRGARTEEIDALEALVRQSQGTLAEVRSYQEETVQTAPLDAVVSKVVLNKGELAATGYPILTLVDLDDVWVTLALREDLLRDVQTGTVLRVEIPALGKTIPVQVFAVSALGDFATWKATSEKDSFDLKSFEVRARPVEKLPGLRPGMTARWTPGR